ncbi:hypothetical protein Tsubulata_010956, partial [Turnera subulata]
LNPNGIYLIGFELKENRRKLGKGSPWLVSNMHFSLKKVVSIHDIEQESQAV